MLEGGGGSGLGSDPALAAHILLAGSDPLHEAPAGEELGGSDGDEMDIGAPVLDEIQRAEDADPDDHTAEDPR